MTDAMPKSSRKRERRQQKNQDFSFNKDLNDIGASTSSETVTVPLHRGYGTYFVHLWVGSPIPQRQTVIVDTASHLTAIACQETIRGRRNGRRRRRTGQQPDFFQPDQSQTFAAANCPHECLEDWSTTNDNVSAETSCGVPSGGQESSPRQCQWTQSYAEGSSWKAYQAQDLVYLAGPDLLDAAHPLERHLAIPLRFGCLQEVSLQFSNQYADGILGLAAHSGQHSAIVAPSSAVAPSIGTTSLMPALFSPYGKISAPIFSLCIQKGQSYGINRSVGGMAGRMSIGGVLAHTNDGGTLIYAQNIQPSGFYTLQVESISISSSQEQVSDLSIQIPSETINIFLNKGKGLIVDSGTTDTYLNEHLLPYFDEAWREVTGHAYKNKASPIKLTPEQVQGLPTIWIKCKEARYQDKSTNEAAVWSITSDQYLGYDDTTQLYTPRLFFTASRGGVLGSNSMEGLDVVFDLQHSRIGWIPSSCEYSGREQRPGDLPASEGFLSSDMVPHGSSHQEIDPCLVPYQIFAILVVESSTTDEAVSQWDDNGIEDFRRSMFEVAHLPQFSSVGARQQLFALEHLNVTVLDISNTPSTILVEIAMMVNESNGLDQRHLSLSSQRTAMHRTQLQNNVRTKASRHCDPFEMFPLARASIEIADGIFKNPGFGDMLAERASKLSRITVSATWIEGIQLYDDPLFEVDHLRDFSRVLHASLIISIFFFVVSLLSLVLGERYRSRGRLMYLSRLRTFGDSDPWYEKLKEMEDVDDGEDVSYGDDELASAQAARLGGVATKRHTAARSATSNTSR